MVLVRKAGVEGLVRSCKDIRPIIVLSYSYRFLEAILVSKVKEGIEASRNSPAFKYQYGYINQRRPLQAIEALKVDIEKSTSINPYSATIFWDIKSAYESVDREILLGKVSKYIKLSPW